MRPDVYLSLTTGTWPSPYWLWYGDSVWRDGNDSDFCGEGSMRQQWINYRDVATQQICRPPRAALPAQCPDEPGNHVRPARHCRAGRKQT